VSGNDVTLGVKFDETNATLAATNTKLDAISQRLDAEFKAITAEIGAQTSFAWVKPYDVNVSSFMRLMRAV
jgi:hypothetical protein